MNLQPNDEVPILAQQEFIVSKELISSFNIELLNKINQLHFYQKDLFSHIQSNIPICIPHTSQFPPSE